MAVNGVGIARLEHLDVAPHSTHIVEELPLLGNAHAGDVFGDAHHSMSVVRWRVVSYVLASSPFDDFVPEYCLMRSWYLVLIVIAV
jgi:hypothetical protein